MFKDARYYADFLNAPEEISTNILASRLAKLEDEGILSKKRDTGNKTRFIYGLTPKGEALMPIMLEIIDWSETWDEKTEVPAEFIGDLRHDRTKLAKRIVENIR